jgi:hypothetical protein
MTSSDEIRDEDFSEEHRLPIDDKGAHKTLRELQTNVYDIIKEVIQNALDSNDRGLPNTVEVLLPKTPKPDAPVLTVIDQGCGITKDYDGKIQGFIEARKATSEKRKRKGAIGNKGIGMMQYTLIGRKIIITSVDTHPTTEVPEMIYRIPLYFSESGFNAFGKYEVKPASDEYMQKFDLLHPGTRVTFYDRDPEEEVIDESKLRKVLRDQYTFILAQNPKVTTIINGRELELPKWIKEHPPKFIQRMSGCPDPEVQDDYNIVGAIWKDPDGTGEIRIYVDGNWVVTHVFEARQCRGYINLNILGVTSSRKEIQTGKTWNELKEKMLREVSIYKKVTSDEEDSKITKSMSQMLKKGLMDLLPLVPTALGSEKNTTKIETTGNPKGTEIAGYKVSNPPDPNRVIIPRKKGGKHDMTNQTRVGFEGSEKVKRQSDEEDERRKKYQDIETIYRHGDGKVLLKLFTDRTPYQMLFDMNNAEYVMVQKSTKRVSEMFPLVIQPALSEIIFKMDDETRAKLSEIRVSGLKSMGTYPKITVAQQQRNMWS